MVLVYGVTWAVRDSQRKERARQEALNGRVSETIWAPDLYDAYEQNEVAADERFKDKVIIVTGIVGKIGKSRDAPYVTLRTRAVMSFGEVMYYEKYVRCFFTSTSIPRLSRLRPGESIRIKGRGDGFAGWVDLRDCTIVPGGDSRR